MNRLQVMRVLAPALVAIAPTFATAQDWAKARLEGSPRHLEFVELERDGRKLKCFVAYPEVSNKAHAVIVIHEIFGLSDWVRSVTDQLAEAGYIAVAPDLLSGAGPDGGGTESLGGPDGARSVIGGLPADQIRGDLDAAVAYATGLPACDGTASVAGFCWGGSQSFRYATQNTKLKFACVFYGSAPEDSAALTGIQCPVYGFYGENDARVNSTLDNTRQAMQAAGKTYEPVIYPGAGHGFFRAGEDPNSDPANRDARAKAWERWRKLLAAE